MPRGNTRTNRTDPRTSPAMWGLFWKRKNRAWVRISAFALAEKAVAERLFAPNLIRADATGVKTEIKRLSSVKSCSTEYLDTMANAVAWNREVIRAAGDSLGSLPRAIALS